MTDTELEQALLTLLADGAAHTEQELVERLSAEPATLAQAVRALRDLGLEPRALPGDGYRLAEPLELLDRQRIAAGLSDETRIRLRYIRCWIPPTPIYWPGLGRNGRAARFAWPSGNKRGGAAWGAPGYRHSAPGCSVRCCGGSTDSRRR